MKTFKDLEFKDRQGAVSAFFSKYAHLKFDNGYGISVIQGTCAYTDKEHPYEVAVLKDGNLCYDTHITNDVIGYCTEEKVNLIMKQIQELKGE